MNLMIIVISEVDDDDDNMTDTEKIYMCSPKEILELTTIYII
jgi:hypothetical protein